MWPCGTSNPTWLLFIMLMHPIQCSLTYPKNRARYIFHSKCHLYFFGYLPPSLSLSLSTLWECIPLNTLATSLGNALGTGAFVSTVPQLQILLAFPQSFPFLPSYSYIYIYKLYVTQCTLYSKQCIYFFLHIQCYIFCHYRTHKLLPIVCPSL